MKFLIYIALSLCLFCSCQLSNQKKETVNGIWKSVGSGWILDIKDSTEYAFYNITASSCLPHRESNFSEISNSLHLKSDTLFMRNGVMTYMFTRTHEKPEICRLELSTKRKNDVLYNFEVFAENIEDHYAFMKLNNIDWPSLYQKQKNKLKETSSEADLYLLIEETLDIINDNHAYLDATDEVYDVLDSLENAASEKLDRENLEDEETEIGDFQISNLVYKNHLIKDMTRESKLLHWGLIEEDIGYILVKTMWLYGDLNLSESMIEEMGFVDAYVSTFTEMDEGEYIKKELEGIRAVMDNVMNDLKNTSSIILDIRFNGGGQDAVSLEIMKRFNDRRIQIGNVAYALNGSVTRDIPLFLEAASNPYVKPTYVLTSRQTGSASESLALASLAMPHVKRIGSNTEGAISTTLDKNLPNGWKFSVSNEICKDLKGKYYENVGVPPDFRIDYKEERQAFFKSVAENLEADRQSILHAVREINE